VEDVVHDRRARLCLLHRREARPPGFVECADLAVQEAVWRLDCLGDLPGNVGKAWGQIVAVAARERDLSAGDRGDRAIAVPLHLEDPARPTWDVLSQGGKHGQVRAPATVRWGRPVIPLPDDQPVLLVAAEVRRHERPGPVELLALEPNGEAAVLLF